MTQSYSTHTHKALTNPITALLLVDSECLLFLEFLLTLCVRHFLIIVSAAAAAAATSALVLAGYIIFCRNG